MAFSNTVSSQSNSGNLSTVNIDELSDSQIKELLVRAKASGESDAALLQAARDRGMSAEQVENLKSRIVAIEVQQRSSVDTSKQNRNTIYNIVQSKNGQGPVSTDNLLPRAFGSDLFTGGGNSFEPNMRLATPVNYVLGPDDQLNINIYGYSVDNWKLSVSPEGNINIPHVGIVNVSGKTIEQATALIKSKLKSNNYAIDNGTTVNVTLGDIRSIKVVITGEANKPGTYTLSSLSTVFNALYAAGGPNQSGSFRNIEIIRDNKLIRKLDVYSFLVSANQKDNIGLKDQDIIRIPHYEVRVQLSGEINHPALFEVQPGETISDLLKFAGGFTDVADRDKMQVITISDGQRSIADIYKSNFAHYKPENGDKYVVGRILERFSNRITIAGAVSRPGNYALETGLTLSKLIIKASGLRPDAFTPRGTITRLNPDNTVSILSFDVKDVIGNSSKDILLQREDLVTISSIFDFRDNYTISVKGEVRRPGDYAFADSMTLENAIIQAGGLTEAASPSRIEVSRRAMSSDANSVNGIIAKVYTVTVIDQLGLNSTNFPLKPFDIVSIYTEPGYQKQQTIKIEGEVLYPGYYTIQTKNERISDIIKQAGGLTVFAYADGGTLKREYSATLGFDKNKVDTNLIKVEQETRLRKVSQSISDSTFLSTGNFRNNYVGIDLNKIIKNPRSETDLLLKDGDVISVPKQQETVSISGQVLIPSSVVYSPGKSFKSYILNAGGFADRALKRKSSILYPNGTVKGTSRFLFFINYPTVKPGSQIYVPKKSPPSGNFSQSAIALTGALASLGILILGILTFHK